MLAAFNRAISAACAADRSHSARHMFISTRIEYADHLNVNSSKPFLLTNLTGFPAWTVLPVGQPTVEP